MKVALVLTGYMRNWEEHFPLNQKNIIEKYNADVYISSYSYSQEHWRTDCININVDEVVNSYKPKNYIFRDQETCPLIKFKENGREKFGREWSERQIKGWYTNYLVLELFDLSEYDIIIKSRPDLSVCNFEINPKKKLVIPAWKVHPGPCEPHQSYADYFAYGNPTNMKKYFQLYSKMKNMHHNDIADISVGETLIYDYIGKYIGHQKVSLDYNMDWYLKQTEMSAEQQRNLYRTVAPDAVLEFPPL